MAVARLDPTPRTGAVAPLLVVADAGIRAPCTAINRRIV